MVSPNLNKRNMMQIPMLSAKFLIAKKPDAGFFSKWSSQHSWNSTLMPIYEWEQVLFVACNGRFEEMEIPGHKLVFVQLDSVSLAKIWHEYQSTSAASPDLKSAKVSPQSQPAEFELLDTPLVSSQFPESIDDLLDLNMSDAPLVKSKPAPVVLPKLEAKYSVPEIESSIAASIQAPETLEVTRRSVTALKSTSVDKVEAWVDPIFKQMNGSFEKSMILLKQGDQLRPWKWDERFKCEAADSSTYSLVSPSAFRIVMRTQKSFHGAVVNNEIMKKFFTQWNQGQTPGHLTIAPLIVDDHVIGMLIGVGQKSANVKSALNLAEKMASLITNQIQIQPQVSKVA